MISETKILIGHWSGYVARTSVFSCAVQVISCQITGYWRPQLQLQLVQLVDKKKVYVSVRNVAILGGRSYHAQQSRV